MAGSTLPPGRYLSCTIDVHPDYGGQTRALLMRNRIFAATGHVSPEVLMVGPARDLAWRRATLLERGLLTDDIRLRNIYEDYRDTDWPGEEPSDQPVADLSSFLRAEESLDDGTPWRRVYRLPDGRTEHDYLRPDGTAFLRMPAFTFKKPDTWPARLTRVSRDGTVAGRFRSVSAWYRQWLRELSGEDLSFVFLDSRFMVPLLAPMRAPNIHLVYLMHNIHLGPSRRWDQPANEVYQRALAAVDDLDAFVTLTERQREDIALLRGRTSNMHVVPNPVDLPAVPEVVDRDRRLVTVVARLEPQKQLSHAVRAFRHVVDAVPDARLEMFGAGSVARSLQTLIDELGLGSSVTLKGHDPHARQALWSSSAFMMTSKFEGYPLSTLESLSHGCPVVSYDIKYGPREQISDGVDGFLVPPGDQQAMAERVVRLLRDPGLVRRFSEAARDKAAHHGNDRFVSDWARVLNDAVARKPNRTWIDSCRLELTELTAGGKGRILGGGRRSSGRLRLRGRLVVEGRSRRGAPRDADVTLHVVDPGTGEVTPLPLDVSYRADGFDLSLDHAGGGWSDDAPGQLCLRVVWANSARQTHVDPDLRCSGQIELRLGGGLTLVGG